MTAALSRCASGRRSEIVAPAACMLVVSNQTPHAIEVRLAAGPFTSVPIGALNPAELLNYSVPCAPGTIWVSGVAIPPQVGAAVTFHAVGTSAVLVPGTRTQVALHWP